jgi:hydrogenase maturation protein HypF
MDYRPMLRDMIEGLDRGRSAAEAARAFHEALAAMLAAGVARACERAGCRRVLLTGGCFVNALLLGRTQDALRSAGCDVFTHRRLSPSDSGVALGQAVVAAALDQQGDE